MRPTTYRRRSRGEQRLAVTATWRCVDRDDSCRVMVSIATYDSLVAEAFLIKPLDVLDIIESPYIDTPTCIAWLRRVGPGGRAISPVRIDWVPQSLPPVTMQRYGKAVKGGGNYLFWGRKVRRGSQWLMPTQMQDRSRRSEP
ncbi:hypothetical protein BHE74_00033077 [Ensete ventricosum]|nr:hypothetical protein BHE74_00033077 [Ensete ventricosum]